MSGGGGGTTNTITQPWSGAQADLRNVLSGAREAYLHPPAYYPGSTFVGPTSGELSAWQNRLNYADQVFGGQQAPRFGEATGALSRALSGVPDYAGLDAMAAAANAPIMRQFEQDVLPSLNQRATFLNNPTGGIKTLNRVLPDIAGRMSENALNLYDTERQRASQNMMQGIGMFPSISALGTVPGDLSAEFAGWGRGFEEQQLADSMNRWNYYANLPQNQVAWYNSQVSPIAGMGNVVSSKAPEGSKLAGALGGGLAAYGLGQALLPTAMASGPVGWGVAGLGALAGMML